MWLVYHLTHNIAMELVLDYTVAFGIVIGGIVVTGDSRLALWLIPLIVSALIIWIWSVERIVRKGG
jgi:hypothetical protein